MRKYPVSFLIAPLCLALVFTSCTNAKLSDEDIKESEPVSKAKPETEVKTADKKVLDTVLYNKLMLAMSNNDTSGRWPVKAPYPLEGAIFPYKRVIAFYGNLYSKRMGILGELPKAAMLQKLKSEVASWQAADSSVPVIPALHYIAVTAQSKGGRDGKYRLRMPFHQIDTVLSWAKEIDALTFVDIQVGQSSVREEIPEFESYLKMPTVHLGIDPEFSMKIGEVPGSRIGTFDSDDINYAVDYLAGIVKAHNLPPKVLVIHRFTQGMIKGFDKIKKVPEVQIVIDMDGYGDKVLKRSTYLRYIYKEPIHFTGFKIFYFNDTKRGADQLFTPRELLQFTPKPVYIQYQ